MSDEKTRKGKRMSGLEWGGLEEGQTRARDELVSINGGTKW
jgi:hypothetical protein